MNDGPRRTKIVATLGPVSSSHDAVAELARAGVNAFRLNFSHGSHDEHAERIRLVRAVQDELGKPLAVMADLQGPKLRIGELPAPRTLVQGDEVVVVGEQAARAAPSSSAASSPRTRASTSRACRCRSRR